MMPPASSDRAPAIRRLATIADLDGEALAILSRAAERQFALPARRELLSKGQCVSAPTLILDGWAASMRVLPHARRQFTSFFVPGDILGNFGFANALAPATVLSLTKVVVCPLPFETTQRLQRAYAVCRTLDEAYVLAHVARLGRLNASERIIDLVLELYERLAAAGLASGNWFEFPLTQQMLADALGVTSVHVNRVLQQARGRGELALSGGKLSFDNVEQSRWSVYHDVIRVA